MDTLAPIGVITYSRINHLKQTIEALQKNILAKESELYIFSDAPQKGDEGIVAKVREYIHTINGFKEVHIVERKTNGRVANGRGGIKQLLDEYGRTIFMEDDIVTAPGFLQFMNDGLEFYKHDDRILSITGYCPPFKIPKECKEEVFILQRFSAWGFSTWKEKFNPFGFELKQHGIDGFLKDKQAIRNFQANGEDMYQMLLLEYNNGIDALDVKLMYYEYKYNMYTLFPSKSLVQNIGHDGSGVHCGVNNKFYHDDLWNKIDNFKFVKDIQVDERIRKTNYKLRRLGFKDKVVNFTKQIGIYPLLRKIKDKH